MSGNFVHPGRRLKMTAVVAHLAGDLVYIGSTGASGGGFYGVVQDDVAAGEVFTLILEGVWTLARAPSTAALGTVLAAPATEIATTLLLGARGLATTPATAGWFPIGRVIATGNASVAKVQLFNPNSGF